MERITWDQSFSVGVKKLDEQHKQIIDMINLLLSEPEAHVRSETISETLTRLTNYARDHFETEERLLGEHGYPELSTQKEEHKAYRKKVVSFCIDTISHRTSVPPELLQYLRDWWVNHILIEDMKYRSFFMERGVM